MVLLVIDVQVLNASAAFADLACIIALSGSCSGAESFLACRWWLVRGMGLVGRVLGVPA